MDTKTELSLGGIYQIIFSDKPCRVLAFDDIEVFYDVYWPSLNKWAFSSDLKSKVFYYRAKPKTFLREAVLLKEQRITSDEASYFRGDLPFRLCRNATLIWDTQQFKTLKDFKMHIDTPANNLTEDILLPVARIVLYPFGPKGGGVKPTLISSENKSGFTYTELLWQAHNLQAPHIKGPQQNGVGIFRLGQEKGVPSYYIGGYYDKGGLIPKQDYNNIGDVIQPKCLRRNDDAMSTTADITKD